MVEPRDLNQVNYFCVCNAYIVFLFIFLSDFSISFESFVWFASKDMVLKLAPQMDKEPSLMVNSM